MPVSELKKVQVRYSDFKTDAEEHPTSGDLALSTNADAVKRSVRNLLMTGRYERRFRPLIGSGLQKYLFENVNSASAQMIRQSIIDTITDFEPRARLVKVKVSVNHDYNQYEATVTFGIVNLPDTVELKQIMRRIR